MTKHIHSTAVIDTGAEIGNDTKVWHWTHVCGKAKIGDNCSLGQNVFVADNVIIGNNVKVQNNVSLYEGVHLGDNVFCGPSVVFTNVFNPRSEVSRKHEYRQTNIENGVTLGANSTIVCGATIEAYAFIGAGAVVNKDIPAYALIVGVPGVQIGWMCQCGEKLEQISKDEMCQTTNCKICKRKYEITSDQCALIE